MQNAEMHNLLRIILKKLTENDILPIVIGVPMGFLHPFLGQNVHFRGESY